MDQRKLGESDFNISRSIVERVAREGQPLLTSNAQTDTRFEQQSSIHVFGLLSILCVPLQLKGETVGVVYVDNRLQTGMFRREDLELLTFIASSATSWKPARQVSGDYYDFILIKPDLLGLVIADVSDKGMPAALFMALTRSTVRASVIQAFSLANEIVRPTG